MSVKRFYNKLKKKIYLKNKQKDLFLYPFQDHKFFKYKHR